MQVSQKQQKGVLSTGASRGRVKTAGLFDWTFKMIFSAFHTSDTATQAALAVVNLVLSGQLPLEMVLHDNNLIGFEEPDGCVRPTSIREI